MRVLWTVIILYNIIQTRRKKRMTVVILPAKIILGIDSFRLFLCYHAVCQCLNYCHLIKLSNFTVNKKIL